VSFQSSGISTIKTVFATTVEYIRTIYPHFPVTLSSSNANLLNYVTLMSFISVSVLNQLFFKLLWD